ncbi:hypothetical protein KBX31_07385 [Liquorilactobacillus satsumensis]|uniref:YiiX/YebB-like N1pC/P60 family cysteine hydrolase n=1 Tax=Liquorilactobacillus satsumensis TaxID=259059 RepID=UPI0021C38A12|nr:YiiX/YebB-like N1pC/P60 family cysteine hydrolase [Liquorilactobacillus satsumensis]MCP9313106.1 hypothetical protein [Liquorilactobacillus satsumensis]MCP9328039.1 hypothetical protein [Liquorilactobacillus satsumensis]MCP9359290.1 hypothetical protein [Liquorilactobacillus satsumensis]
MLKTGDLVFVTATADELAKTIGASTQLNKGKNILPSYSHVGLIEVTDHGEKFVLHATSKGGCIRETLSGFKKRVAEHCDFYRLSPRYHFDPSTVLRAAYSLLGSPYNFSFAPTAPGFYCADFIYTIFPTGIFSLIPMTFGPNHTVLPFWHDYYQKLAVKIPVAEPGINPNEMLHQVEMFTVFE